MYCKHPCDLCIVGSMAMAFLSPWFLLEMLNYQALLLYPTQIL